MIRGAGKVTVSCGDSNHFLDAIIMKCVHFLPPPPSQNLWILTFWVVNKALDRGPALNTIQSSCDIGPLSHTHVIIFIAKNICNLVCDWVNAITVMLHLINSVLTTRVNNDLKTLEERDALLNRLTTLNCLHDLRVSVLPHVANTLGRS